MYLFYIFLHLSLAGPKLPAQTLPSRSRFGADCRVWAAGNAGQHPAPSTRLPCWPGFPCVIPGEFRAAPISPLLQADSLLCWGSQGASLVGRPRTAPPCSPQHNAQWWGKTLGMAWTRLGTSGLASWQCHQELRVLAIPQSSRGCSSAMGPGAACSPISPFTAAVRFPLASLASGSLLLWLLCL